MFRALGHPGRLAVFELIRETSGAGRSATICACDIAERLGLSAPVVSRHLRELRLSHLVRTEKRGQWLHCTVNPDALACLRDCLQAASHTERAVAEWAAP